MHQEFAGIATSNLIWATQAICTKLAYSGNAQITDSLYYPDNQLCYIGIVLVLHIYPDSHFVKNKLENRISEKTLL